MCDAVLLAAVGVRVVLVHGGGPEITATLQRMGKESRFVGGLRYTDRETAEVAQMVLAGKLSKDLVAAIGRHGGRAVALCGMDGGLFEARKKQSDTDLGFVGEIAAVNTAVVEDAPVSYTHLDVYKRQVPGHDDVRARVDPQIVTGDPPGLQPVDLA